MTRDFDISDLGSSGFGMIWWRPVAPHKKNARKEIPPHAGGLLSLLLNFALQ